MSLVRDVTERRPGVVTIPRRSQVAVLTAGLVLAASVLVATAITAYARGVTVVRAPGSTVVVPVDRALLGVLAFVVVAALATAYCRHVRRDVVHGALDVVSGAVHGEPVDQQYALARWRETRVLGELRVISERARP